MLRFRRQATLYLMMGCLMFAHLRPSLASLNSPAFKVRRDGIERPILKAQIEARLDKWLELTAPRAQFSAGDYATFLLERPWWPKRAVLLSRFQDALIFNSSSAEQSAFCPRLPITAVRAFDVCFAYLTDSTIKARQLWRDNIVTLADEKFFLERFAFAITPDDNVTRFHRLLQKMRLTAASRQISRLAPGERAVAQSIVAFAARDQRADAFFNALSRAQQRNNLLVFYRLRALRLAGNYDAALNGWRQSGFAAQRLAPSFPWARERLTLARYFIMNNKAEAALELADDRTPGWGDATQNDARLLSGWIFLRLLNAPSRALPYFLALSTSKDRRLKAAGAYWSARSYAALKNMPMASRYYMRAAQAPNSFFALLALGAQQRISVLNPHAPDLSGLAKGLRAMRRPATTPLDRDGIITAARRLYQMGRIDDAGVFLRWALLHARFSGERAFIAQIAAELGVKDVKVQAERMIQSSGMEVFPLGWPREAYGLHQGKEIPLDVLRAVIRQESSFHPSVVSPAGAIGLMQLEMPTAQHVARGGSFCAQKSPTRFSVMEPACNIALGSAYLTTLLRKFDGNLAFALAAYNAGPNRVMSWLKQGKTTPNLSQPLLIDWIVSIPYSETRIYVERVMENYLIYKAIDHDRDE